MNFLVRCERVHSVVVVADSEDEAIAKAEMMAADDWDQVCYAFDAEELPE